MKLYEASMPEDLERMGIEIGKVTVEKMVGERAKEIERKRKVK